MCKWKDIKSDTRGLMKGCAISAFLLIILVYYFVNYSHIPLLITANMAQHFDQQTNPPESSFSISILTTVIFVAIWFMGITFSTFVRALAEKMSNHSRGNNNVTDK